MQGRSLNFSESCGSHRSDPGSVLDSIDVYLRSQKSNFFCISTLKRNQRNTARCGFWCKVRLDRWNTLHRMTQTPPSSIASGIMGTAEVDPTE